MAVVETERHGQILVVRMNRPERLNALRLLEMNSAPIMIAAAQRPPTVVEISTITRRKLLTRAELRRRFDDVTVACIQPHGGSSRHTPSPSVVIGK